MANKLVKRDAMGRILPGSVCNPSGKPKGTAGLARYIQQETGSMTEVADFVLQVFRGKAVERPDSGDAMIPTMEDRKWAATWLTDRGVGKAPLQIEVSEKREETVIDFSHLSDEDLDKLDEILEEKGVIIDAEFEEITDGDA